mgnify:CR=1 FL=1
MTWVSVEDGLPKSRQIIDVVLKGERIINIKFTKTGGFDYTKESTWPRNGGGLERNGKVTHWMERPMLPEVV